MNTTQSGSSEKSGTKGFSSSLGKSDTAGSFSGSSAQGDFKSQDGKEGKHLDEFVSYMKSNWKVILSELVAAGVSAYMAHSSKEKAAKI